MEKNSIFIWTLAGVLALGSGYYIYDANRVNTSGKEIKGEKVIASFKDNTGITEKDYLKNLNDYSDSSKFSVWRASVINTAVSDDEITKEEQEQIDAWRQNIKSSLLTAYGHDTWKYEREVAQYGLTDYKDYAKMTMKFQKMKKAYVDKNIDHYREAIENTKPRKIKYVGVTNPNDYPHKVKDDTNAITRYVDTSFQELAEDFRNAIKDAKEGTETDWFPFEEDGETTFYKAYVYDLGYEKNKDVPDMYTAAVSAQDEYKILYEYSKDLSIYYQDKDYQKFIEDVLKNNGVEIETVKDSKTTEGGKKDEKK